MTILGATTSALYPFLGKGFRTRGIVNKTESSANEIELGRNELWRLVGDNRWRVIICLQGELWVTQPRDLHDYLLTEGEMLIITQPGTVVIQARAESRLQLTPSLAAPAYVGDFAKTIFR